MGDGAGATEALDTAQGAEADGTNIGHLPTTNRGSGDVDVGWVVSFPKDCQGSSPRHRQGVSTHQQSFSHV